MATEVAYLYGQSILNALMGKVTDISAVGSYIKVALLADTYTLDQDTHVSYNDIYANEITGTGYTGTVGTGSNQGGGVALTTKALAYASKVTTFSADNPSWATATFTAMYAVIYDDTPSGYSNKKILYILDFGENKTCSVSTFQIVWAAAGIFAVTVA